MGDNRGVFGKRDAIPQLGPERLLAPVLYAVDPPRSGHPAVAGLGAA